MTEIVEPTVRAMAAKGMPFTGVLYAGLMLTASGPQLIEYNVRFGDPVVPGADAAPDERPWSPPSSRRCDGQLDHFHLRWFDHAAVCVVMVADGYPGPYREGHGRRRP